jgi:sugar-specific transcriptional regulator TrmB
MEKSESSKNWKIFTYVICIFPGRNNIDNKIREAIKVKEHVEFLQNLGLTEYQAKTAVVLFAKREATAEEICRHSGIPLTKIYSVLKGLEYLGIATGSPGKPRIYRCGEPAEIVNMLLKKLASRIDLLKEAKKEQLKKIKTVELPAIAAGEKTHPVLAAEVPA